MIKRKKILSLFVFCSFSISCLLFPKTANAQVSTKNSTSINLTTSNVSNDIETYAQNEFAKQLLSISTNPRQYGFDSSEIRSFQLGQPFTVYNLYKNSLSTMNGYYYPVLYNNTIKGIFSVVKNSNGQFTSTLTKSFADKLNSLKNGTFTLINVDGNLFATSKSSYILIHKSLNNASRKLSGNLSSSVLRQLNRLFENRNYRVININDFHRSSPRYFPSNFPSYPSRNNNSTNTVTTSKTLPLSIVLQGDHPWCWAATAASLINYNKGTSLAAKDIVNYTFGQLVDNGGTTAEIIAAYKHWGLTSKEYNTPLSYSSVTSYINNNTPINALMYYNDGSSLDGHSMSLIGYSTLNGHNTYTMIDPNENYYVSVDATNTGTNVEYNLDGDEFRWYETIVPSTK